MPPREIFPEKNSISGGKTRPAIVYICVLKLTAYAARKKRRRICSIRPRSMKMKAKGFFISAAAMLIAAILAGCAGQPAAVAEARSARQAAIEQATPIRTEPAQRPAWVDSVPDTPTTLSFIGTSRRYATVADSRNDAMENGRTQLVDYYGTVMVNKARTFAGTFGIASDVLAPQVAAQELRERIAQNVSQALAARQYYTLVYLDATNREAFEVFVLMEVEKALVRRVIDNYGQEQAADYARRAAAEQDQVRRQQLERAAEFFGGNLSSTLDI
jgi:hypothetical protein